MRNDFESNYLAHAGWLKKGEKRAGHKYFERVEQAGKYLYFYTREEYEAWLHRGQKTAEDVKNKVKGAASKLSTSKGSQKSNDSFGKAPVQTLQQKLESTRKQYNSRQGMAIAIARGKQAAYDLATRSSSVLTKSNVNSVINKGQSAVNTLLGKAQNALKKTSNEIKKQVSNGEKIVNDALKKASKISLSDAVKKFEKSGVAKLTQSLAQAASVKLKDIGEKINNVVNAKKIKAEQEAKKAEEKRQREIQNKDRLLSHDAEDSKFEDLAEHKDIKQKEYMSKDDDMMAVNQDSNITREVYTEMQRMGSEANRLWRQYELSGDEEDYQKYLAKYLEYAKLYNKNYGYLNNCANCTLTYDLRRRGYDVSAPWNQEGTLRSTTYGWYKMDPDKDVDNWTAAEDGSREFAFSKEQATNIVKSINDTYPEGSYGHFLVQWQGEGAGGHDCVWSKENGRIIIRDTQTGQIIQPERYLQMSCSVSYFRADDKELTNNAYNIAKLNTVNSKGEDATKDKDYMKIKNTMTGEGKSARTEKNVKKRKQKKE